MQLKGWFVVITSLVSIVRSEFTNANHLETKTRSRAILEVAETTLFKKFILCEEVSNGLACFNRYGAQLVKETESKFGRDGDSKRVFGCIQKVLKANRVSTFSLEVLSCFDYLTTPSNIDEFKSNESQQQDEQIIWGIWNNIPIWKIIGFIGLGIFYYSQTESESIEKTASDSKLEDNIVQSTVAEKDSNISIPCDWNSGKETGSSMIQKHSSLPDENFDEKENSIVESSEIKPCLIAFNGSTFDLNTPEGKLRWRSRFQKQNLNISNPSVNNQNSTANNQTKLQKVKLEIEPEVKPEHKNDNLLKPLYSIASKINIPREIDIEKVDKPNIGNTQDQSETEPSLHTNRVLRKARTDLNVHNPEKPVPSVLDHPMIDKKGKPLRRIFIPGRGWVSAKALEQEKLELIRQFDYQQVEPSETLSY
ncbi:putative secreted protein [Wickerhamomyces ciferrii]|uniref:Secreted protein n=1 Tax=Wickerhamomyces ciferrii (strain ATCC 14091 / BCRC 22168 / CBS 111 / JCM 3599 / NBRC 0793 / NRRL Y-1031 F-60-10) TaxID=1206466 RepID=K0KJS5_WICCF|nr:uncharacterized protein BN7_5097 [Wickerhamomyces ciferrii]CCH45515.1 putative secreted protein [Wickerhamomyces ciferrii]